MGSMVLPTARLCAVITGALLTAACATFGEKDLQEFNSLYHRDFPVNPRFKVQQSTETEYLITVHQGAALFSPGFVRVNYLTSAAKIVAEDICKKNGKVVSSFDVLQIGDTGWVSVQGSFTCATTVTAAQSSKDPPPKPTLRNGTAFCISRDGHLLTAAHVVSGAARINIIVGGVETRVEIVRSDPVNDLALLKGPVSCAPLPLATADAVDKGSEVLTLGFPLVGMQGQEQKATFGRINAFSGVGGDVRYFQIDVPVQPGNSGGPLLSKQGEVVGIVSATLSQKETISRAGIIAQNVNYAIKVDYAFPLLTSVKSNRVVPTDSRRELDIPAVVRQSQASVVLVVAE